MDLLYRAYSSPMDLMRMYINQGRFGTFVEGFMRCEYERMKAEAEKENDQMLWIAYVHSYAEDSFADWKKKVCKEDGGTRKSRDDDLTDEDIAEIINGLFPSKG